MQLPHLQSEESLIGLGADFSFVQIIPFKTGADMVCLTDFHGNGWPSDSQSIRQSEFLQAYDV